MKVVVLGAAGGMGSVAARIAAGFTFVEELVVADSNGDAAARVARAIGEPAQPLQLDIGEGAALAGTVGRADAVLNCVVPFFRFGVPVLQACIEAGVDYLDINDDWEPTLDMLEHDGAAREAGITAVVGIGASPGVSNLLATLAMGQLDSADTLHTGWGLGGAGGGEAATEPSAAVVHFIHQITGTVRLRRGGRWTDVVPLEEVSLNYPGIGTGSGWTVGHPEPLTVPRYYPNIADSTNLVVTSPRVIEGLRAVAHAVDTGAIDVVSGARELLRPVPPSPEPAPARAPSPGIRLPELFAIAMGAKGGQPATAAASITASPPGGMGGITGVPLALGLQMLHELDDTPAGVFAPEALLDANRFFELLGPYCEPPPVPGSPLVAIARSWD
ncbi:MAG: saccharopine dehydrogenase family protein [Dehalococcoidia bacterium]